VDPADAYAIALLQFRDAIATLIDDTDHLMPQNNRQLGRRSASFNFIKFRMTHAADRHPKSDLADDAQYYIGESLAGDSKYRDAAVAYERVIRDYPSSNILPEAWYKVGISYDRLGQIDKAREAFEFVVKNYPDTDAGRIAKQGLDRLNRRTR